jgi:hypothetical protein
VLRRPTDSHRVPQPRQAPDENFVIDDDVHATPYPYEMTEQEQSRQRRFSLVGTVVDLQACLTSQMRLQRRWPAELHTLGNLFKATFPPRHHPR